VWEAGIKEKKRGGFLRIVNGCRENAGRKLKVGSVDLRLLPPHIGDCASQNEMRIRGRTLRLVDWSQSEMGNATGAIFRLGGGEKEAGATPAPFPGREDAAP